MTARDEVLARIRQANAAAGGAAHAPGGRRVERTLPDATASGTGRALDLLADRLIDYRARSAAHRPDGLATEVAAALADRGARRVVMPPGLDPALLGQRGRRGHGRRPAGGPEPRAELDGMDGVVTGAAVAIAETGTIVLDASPGQGRRALTLVPDYHLCMVDADQVVAARPRSRGPAAATRTARSPGSAARPPPATSNSSASKACTAPARWSSSAASGTR